MKSADRLLRVAALAAVVGFVGHQAVASHPDILRDYRFIPSHSTLEVTGGFAGVNDIHHVKGTFGLVTGYEEGVSCLATICPPPPTHIPFAEFVDVHARLEPPPIFGIENLDEVLNLSSLDGTFTTPNHLFFSGEEFQDQPFRLRATIVGPLIHLVGVNEPSCCDFFDLKFDAFAHLRPFADFNFDGAVNAADFTTWRDHLGMPAGATLDDGDADGDADGDMDDYQVWKSTAGTVIDMAAFAEDGGAASAIVPEPATCLLTVVALAATTLWRRRVLAQ